MKFTVDTVVSKAYNGFIHMFPEEQLLMNDTVNKLTFLQVF